MPNNSYLELFRWVLFLFVTHSQWKKCWTCWKDPDLQTLNWLGEGLCWRYLADILRCQEQWRIHILVILAWFVTGDWIQTETLTSEWGEDHTLGNPLSLFLWDKVTPRCKKTWSVLLFSDQGDQSSCATVRSSNQGRLALHLLLKVDVLTPLSWSCLSVWLLWSCLSVWLPKVLSFRMTSVWLT